MDFGAADDFRKAKLPGFCFNYCERNEILRKYSPEILPTPTKTGTTSVGIIFSNGVILGSDYQNINNSLRESNAEKLFYLSDNIFCCCAGMAADNYWVSKLISSDLKLLQLEMKRKCRVVTAVRIAKQILFQYQGFLDVNFIIGGVDINGSHLVTVYPHGSSDKLFYSGIGSGSMPSMSVIENRYKIGLGEKEALELLVDSISAGIYNDLNSGTSINAVIITKEGFSQKIFQVEEKSQSQQSVIVKDFSVANTEIKRYDLITTSEKLLR